MRDTLRRVIPHRARRIARVAVDATRGVPPPPAGRTIRFPADVADRDVLRSVLLDTDINPSVAEMQMYLDESLDRFRITVALLPQLPPDARVLELGSNPYFLTRLLRKRGLQVISGNYFGDSQPKGHGRQVTHSDGVETAFEYEHFNVETDVFPWDDGSFDLVLCCEILEHLPADPVHMLTEIHRVLRKESGHLLLTTPNANRLENLYKSYRGENVYEKLSAYGTYGRHNRVYTVAEVRDLLDGCGFVDLDVFDMDIHDHTEEWTLFPPGATRQERGCNIFAVGCAGAQRRWRHPSWLYASAHALKRIVEPGVTMGANCDLQSSGFHPLETMAGRYGRWTGAEPRCEVLLDVPAGADGLRIEGIGAPGEAGPVELRAECGDWSATWRLPASRPFTLAAPFDAPPGPCTVTLQATPWSPASRGMSADTRTLGAYVSSVAAGLLGDAPVDALQPSASAAAAGAGDAQRA